MEDVYVVCPHLFCAQTFESNICLSWLVEFLLFFIHALPCVHCLYTYECYITRGILETICAHCIDALHEAPQHSDSLHFFICVVCVDSILLTHAKWILKF